MRAVVVAIVLALLVSPIGAHARSAEAEWSYSVAFSVWASPASPGDTLDAYDPLLGDAIDEILIFFVIDLPRPITQEEFESSYQDLVGEAAIVDPTPLSPAPGLLTDSVAFAGAAEGVSAYLLAAYESDLIFISMAMDTSGAANDGSTFERIVRNYLTSFQQSSSPPLTEALVSGFVGDDQFATERPLGLLPSRGDIPADFQLLDKDLLLVDDPTFDIFGGGT